MMSKTLTSLLLTAALLLFTTGCDLDSEIDQTNAAATIAVEFIDAETGEPIAGVSVLVLAAFDGSDNLLEQGTIQTDENGSFESPITSLQETTITLLEFNLDIDGEVHSVQQEVELELTFEEPFNSVDLSFEFDTDENNDENEE
jgi:5-hydroxyisourate hydrolase-like protein (transthyretin family)